MSPAPWLAHWLAPASTNCSCGRSAKRRASAEVNSTRLIIVGGFLGAGKTTWIEAAAKRLVARGLKVAVITNGQAVDLVDTGTIAKAGLPVAEVAGGCFCCKFGDLTGAAS